MDNYGTFKHLFAVTTDKLQECRDIPCKVGEQCLVRKFWCSNPPCPTMVYCSKSRTDASAWIEQCKQIGCRSEYDCFLRKPQKNCTKPLCNHTPDCLNEVENYPVFAEFEEEDFLEEHGKSEDHFPDESTISSTKSEFAEWLDSVADLLDRVSYAKWLYEVRRSSANVPEFQAWLQQYHRSCQSDINTASDPDTFGYQARIGLSHRDRTLAQKAGRVVGVAGDGGARLDPSTRVPAGYILASRMQNPPSPDFKFNEAATPAAPVVAAIPSHLNTATTLAYQHAAITPSIALPLPLHYLALPQQTVHHNSADVRVSNMT
uniref:Uncharacterized protein n=1 Tax=Trichogramma kaykai TaxID=54128 RepID=A0ABD2WHC9_9HYME